MPFNDCKPSWKTIYLGIKKDWWLGDLGVKKDLETCEVADTRGYIDELKSNKAIVREISVLN